jgi:hypothetical protein
MLKSAVHEDIALNKCAIKPTIRENDAQRHHYHANESGTSASNDTAEHAALATRHSHVR